MNELGEKLLKLFGSMRHQRWIPLMKSVGSWSFSCDISDERVERENDETGGSMRNPRWRSELKNIRSWSFPCDISDGRIEQETAEAGWFYANSAMGASIKNNLRLRLKLCGSMWNPRWTS